MKKIVSCIMIILPFIMITGCEKYELGNPLPSSVADFTYSVGNDGYAPAEVTFTNKSLNASSFHWDFGNGQTSADTNAVIFYEAPGLYSVTLTITAVNDVHYNQLVKTMIVNVKDINAGKSQVLYFTTRTPDGGAVHMVILNDEAPVVQDFEAVELTRPYGITADTATGKVFVSDYSLGYIYRFNADGKNPVRILDINVPGQEIVDSPQGLMVVDSLLYWGRPGGIYRCNLDGTNPEVYIATGLDVAPEYPIDMQYDAVSGKIYLCNDKTDYSGGYFSMNFDGTGIVENVPDIDGTAIEVDFNTGTTYMAVYPADGTPVTDYGIYSCNLDGSGLAKIADYGDKATWGVAIDDERGKLFWSFKMSNTGTDGKIIRANLNGSDQEDWVTGVNPNAMHIVWIRL
jgi:PKD repeat protein